MVIVDSPFHLTFSSCHYLPCRACLGKCKKVWWDFDFTDRPDNGICHQCSGQLDDAVEGVHFKTVQIAKRPFRPKDFKGFKEISKSEQDELAKLLGMRAEISHMSKVKAAFVDKAKREWC